MVAETPGWLKRRLGVLAYTIMGSRAALRSVLRREFFATRIVVDGQVHERRAAAVMIANFGAVLGNRITLGPAIRTDDGFSTPACSRRGRCAMRCASSGVCCARDFDDDPCMLYVRGREIHVETTPPMQWQADGELMGTTPFDVVVEPLAVRLLVPAGLTMSDATSRSGAPPTSPQGLARLLRERDELFSSTRRSRTSSARRPSTSDSGFSCRPFSASATARSRPSTTTRSTATNVVALHQQLGISRHG